MQPIDVAADESQDGGHQGDRREHGDEHRGRRPDGDPLHELEPHEQQPQEGDHHDGAGEEDRPTGRGQRDHGGCLGATSLVEPLAVAGHDEQGVVDPHTDPDHRGDLRREIRHADPVGEHKHERDADADAEQRGEDRQAHRQERPERDQQDDHGGDEADGLGPARGLELGVLNHVPAELDRQPADSLLEAVAPRFEVSYLRLGDVLRLDREVDPGVGDLAVLGDLGCTLRRLVRIDHVGDPGHQLHLAEVPLHGHLDGRGVHTLVGLEHDVDRAARLRWEPRLEQVEGVLGLGSGEREVARVVAAANLRREDGPDQRHDPDRQNPPSVGVAPPCQPLQHVVLLSAGVLEGTIGSVRNFPTLRDFSGGDGPFTKVSPALLRSGSAMVTVHKLVGYVIVGGWGLFFLWGLVFFLIKREPNQWYWRLLAALQAVLILQLAVGITLLALGHRLPSALHFFYGSVFPAVVLVIAHVVARGLEEEAEAWKVFAVAGFFLFGLTLRALTTGLGLP